MNMPLTSILAILTENLRPFFWPLLVLLALELVVLIRLWAGPRPLHLGRGLGPALLLGTVVAVAVFALAPSLTQADFSALSGWLDWGFLSLAALGAGVIAALLAWPFAVWWRLRSP
jgi:hypothetical protein